MKTFRKIICLLFAVVALHTQAQIINMNPNPNGDPWISGSAVAPSPGAWSDAIEYTPSAASLATQLPTYIYNEDQIWFPSIFNQYYNACCVQVAEVWYTFAYEINRKRGVAASDLPLKTNLYHPLYTYNFLNGGTSTAYTYFKSGFDIIKQNGCPSWDVYDDPCLNNPNLNYKYWMTGFDKYKQGMNNTISSVITFNYSSNVWLENLKHWVADHGNGESTGGLAVIGVNTAGWNPNGIVPNGSPYHSGEKFISSLGTPGSGHALTIVGYNDDIWIQDINGDGQYTNDRDVNGDGIFNIKDFEKGAFKVANSWGAGWNTPYGGFILVPYKHFYPGNTGLVISYAYSCDVFPESNDIPEPSLTLKTSMEHPARNKISMSVGYAALASNNEPASTANFYSFNFQGGANDMRGAYPGPIENGLNFGYFYGDADFGKLFLRVTEKDPGNTSNGTINYFSLIDHRWNEDFELFCDQTNVNIVNNGATTLAIDYHLLPHEQPVTSNLDITSNRVSRFTTSIANNAVLSINEGVRIDMYNSEIMIRSGSTVILEDNVTFLAKSGHCKIIIYGDINIGSNLNLKAEGDAVLELILINPNIVANLNNSSFEKSGLVSYAGVLDISNSSFNQCPYIYSHQGNVTVNNSAFYESGLFLENQSKNSDFTARVSGSTFSNTDYSFAIDVLNYGKYFIENNNIESKDYGIRIINSGNGNSGNQSIFGNNIHGCGQNGILAYNVTGSFANNYIHNNLAGLRLMNNCNVALLGNASAQTPSQTQRIKDNTSFEVYCSQFSFPWYFRYNVIIDEDNLGNTIGPLLYWAYPAGSRINQKDIRYNCWGNNFSAIEDLYPSAYFNYNPTWCPNGILPPLDPIVDLFTSAVEQFENGNYSNAKNLFQLLIQQYPKSDYAQAAMKELLRLEEYVSSDYGSLKDYYRSNDSIVCDTLLNKLGDYLANQCDVKLENWQQAIHWFENKITNPSCLEDSVFAIIDLGYVYFLMENQGLKSAYVGNMVQFKPETKEKYFEHRDYLLSLLPGEMMNDKLRNDLTNLSFGSLLQNVPNPFTGSTQIWYKVEKKVNITISITDLTGKEIQKIEQGTKDKGTYKADFVNSVLTPGTYFYSLKLDGKKSDTKKMVITR